MISGINTTIHHRYNPLTNHLPDLLKVIKSNHANAAKDHLNLIGLYALSAVNPYRIIKIRLLLFLVITQEDNLD